MVDAEVVVSWPQDDVIVVSLVGDHDLHSAGLLASALSKGDAAGIVVIDLSETTFLDSTVLGVVARCAHAAARRGAGLRLVVGRGSNMEHVLDLAGLTRSFDCVPTVAEALA